MLTPQYTLGLHSELVIDLFAGGGGASTGIEQAIGRPVDIAVNHDPEAVALHTVNHPQTQHYVSDVFEINPLMATRGMPVGLLWASPDCKHFSKAKGGKPVSKRIRGLAWVVVKWAKAVRPRVIVLENVEEFQTWGPLTDDGMPCSQRKGETFEMWKAQLNALGYRIEHRELRASDYGTPTIRKRFFMVARCDGLPIVWPEQSHFAKPAKGQKGWVPASEIIDWSIPCPSIFERNKSLVDATCRRVAKGIMRYVINARNPFIVNGMSAHIMTMRNAGKPYTAANEPTHTITAGGAHQFLVAAFLAKHYTGVVGSDLDDPIGTVTSIDHHTLVTSHLIKLRNNQYGQSVEEPMPTLTAGGGHAGEVRAFLVKYYGNEQDGVSLQEPLHTVPTRDRFGLVTVHGINYQIVDIGLRMLTPRELYRAQGFPESYIIDHKADGTPLTKTAQVRMCGNSVCPPLAHVIIAANYSEQQIMRKIA